MKQQNLLNLFLTLAIVSACGKSGDSANINIPTTDLTVQETDPADLQPGTYAAQGCFLNKLASLGFGTPVYTLAEMTFNPDGSGSQHFKLYLNSHCSGEADLEGVLRTQVTVVNTIDNVSILRVDQREPGDPSGEVQTFFMAAFYHQGNYHLDIDYTDGISGPFLAEPTEAEIAVFARDPLAVGVFMQKQ